MRSEGGEHIDAFGFFGFSRHFVWRNGYRVFGIAIAYRCPACGSLTHGFRSDEVGDLDTGHAYFVCRKCGDKQLKGQVAADGSVMWYGGGSGNFDKNGDCTGDAGGALGDGGGDGGE